MSRLINEPSGQESLAEYSFGVDRGSRYPAECLSVWNQRYFFSRSPQNQARNLTRRWRNNQKGKEENFHLAPDISFNDSDALYEHCYFPASLFLAEVYQHKYTADRSYSLVIHLYSHELSMFQLAYLICTPIIGRTLHKIGRKNGILFGYVIITIATAGFGLLSFFDEA